MILPTKHIPTSQSLIGVGALLLGELQRPRSITALWDTVKEAPEIGTFQRFVLAVDFLYALGAVTYDKGLLRRARP